MIDLSTPYLGLTLKNPLVPSASPLSADLDTAMRLEDAGAAALVMHSLFEEAQQPDGTLMRYFPEQATRKGDASRRGGLDSYLEHLQRLKSRLEIPVVASLNGVSPSGWIEHGQALQQAGADALELNVYHVAADARESGESVEARYLGQLAELRGAVSLPIAMKLSPFFSSLPHFVRQLEQTGAQGVALFNRFYQPDIDLDTLCVVDRLHFSGPDEVLLRTRWLSILHGRTSLTLAATGGVSSHEEALKLLLVGADVVHLASCLLEHGPGRLTQILQEIEHWMGAREYGSVTQIKGSLSQQYLSNPTAMARASYLRVLDSYAPRTESGPEPR